MWTHAVSVLFLFVVGAATEETGRHEDCYQITTGIMAGIVAGDILLTVLLLIPVYYCIRQKGTEQSDKDKAKNYINMMAKCN